MEEWHCCLLLDRKLGSFDNLRCFSDSVGAGASGAQQTWPNATNVQWQIVGVQQTYWCLIVPVEGGKNTADLVVSNRCQQAQVHGGWYWSLSQAVVLEVLP